MKSKILVCLAVLIGPFLMKADQAKIKYGISETHGAAGKRFDFKQSPLAEFYLKKNIEATLFPLEELYKKRNSIQKLEKLFKQFHVLNIRSFGEGINSFDQNMQAAAETTSKALQEYVKGGGGLIVQLRPSRYSNSQYAKFWNAVFAPFGLTVENNHGITSSKAVKGEQKPGSWNNFFFTENIVRHDITKEVRGLWLPVNSFDRFPGTPLMKYSPDFSAVVMTGKDGGTYFCSEHDRSNFVAGITPVIPSKDPLPIIAVRQFGKGFVVSVAVDMIHTGMNHRNPMWGDISESKGLNGKPSDLMQLMANAVVFAAEPALKNPDLGTWESKNDSPVKFPEAVYWDDRDFPRAPGPLVYGIAGAHTVYSDGKSTIEEYVKRAKEAGLHFIVFADPIEKLSPEKMERIKAECKKYTDENFFACPGMEFTDGSGLKRFVFGNRITHPGDFKFHTGKNEYIVFDGKVVQNSGYFIAKTCAFSQNGFLDAGDFSRCHVHPENLWWFWISVPYVFEREKLISDNTELGRRMLHDLRLLVPITFDRIFSAEDVQKSKNTAVMGGHSLTQIMECFNSSCSSSYWAAGRANLFCSYGNGGALKVNSFYFINPQEDPRRLHTRGTQRIRGIFNVESPDGIKEVRIMDRNQKPVRVFAGKGLTILEQQFELVHDKQYYLYLEVEDMKGARLISNMIRIYDYKQGLFRCNDNMNILGPLGICWHPNWPEKINIYKYFRNSEILSVQGWDRANGDCPRPQMVSENALYVEGKGRIYPSNRETRDGVVMDVKFNGGDLQIVEAQMDEIVESFGNKKRGATSYPSPPKVVSKNEYFAHHQRVYYFRDRQDFHIAWDHRRLRESLQDYDGAMCLVTGEIKFRKNVTLSNIVPIPFVIGQTKVDPGNIGAQDSVWIVKDAEKGLVAEKYGKKEKKQFAGRIAPGGFATTVWSPLGSLAVFPVSDSDWRYRSVNSSNMYFGFGTPGKSYKAGECIKYAFISANVISDATDPQKYEKLSSLIRGDYPNRVERGKKISEPLFFHTEAVGNETVFEVGPAKGLGIDLPIKVSNLQDNGCVAIYSTKRPHFRFIGIADGEKTAYTQEPMEEKNRIWIGNVFVADDPALKLTLVADGQTPNAKPFLEIHNPTDREIKAVISSPRNAPVFGGKSFTLSVPPKSSIINYGLDELSERRLK